MKERISQIVLKMIFILSAISLVDNSYGYLPPRQFYEIRIYHLKNKEQEERVDKFLQTAYLPALHRKGIKTVGVFKPVNNDTSSDRRIFLFIPFKSLDQFSSL